MKKLIPIITLITLMLSSCEGWLDVNTDPNNPSEFKVEKSLPVINQDIGDIMSYDFMSLGYITAVYTHQLTSRESIDQYGITGSDLDIEWANLYVGPVKEIESLIEKSTETDNMQYAGIGKLYKAFLYSQIVDLWGDVPFSEAAVAGNYNPQFGADEEIYANLFTLIDEAISDLQNEDAENIIKPGSDEIIYNGNIDSWIKFAKSLKLKLYVQVIETSLYNQSEVDALLADDLIGPGDDFSIPYGPELAPDNRNPGFVGEYAGGQISAYISPWFYEIMKGEADHIFTGIEDPRIPYYFCTQINEGGDTETPPEYRNGQFVSIYFGSLGVNRDGSGRNTFTMIGLYPVGGAFDSPDLDKSSSLGVDDGTGAAPYRILTFADILYLKAELIAQGKISGDLKATFEQALVASFEQVDAVTSVAGMGTEPMLSESEEVNTYIENVLAEFDGGNNEKQFEIVMTQKWISKFGSSIDAYTDYRRTGYPVLFDPNTMGNIADGGPDGSGNVPVESTRPYAVSFPWSADELNMNDNAPEQKSPSSAKVFWDK
ncbi:MAG: SusD/RagB family nutrient-binding outer membrane lipoprotein [Prolixibacteraceae bacterium]|nr:SusD/RagB family nutrient-binding outer membrane lipoprotein [Prolixibacteraceae bacterium]